ncbi:MAG TPA: hypothetical protein VNZ45_11105 [Bacteroidia bacterium]|nr:hypothetical protein [Bacteroidia bacterium]
MEPKESLIKETLESIDGIGRAAANPFLYDKIMDRMQRVGEGKTLQPAVMRWAMVLGIALICLNVLSVLQYHKSSQSPSKNESAFASEYFSYINNY